MDTVTGRAGKDLCWYVRLHLMIINKDNIIIIKKVVCKVIQSLHNSPGWNEAGRIAGGAVGCAAFPAALHVSITNENRELSYTV